MKPEFNPLKIKIQSLLARPDYHPLRINELIAKLKLQPHERKLCKRVVDHMLEKGIIVRVRKDRLVLPMEADLVTGRIQMNEKGFGFVVPEPTPSQSPSEDIFIPAEDTGVAMHHDLVVARIQGTSTHMTHRGNRKERSKPRPIGRVIRILERAQKNVIGVLQRSGNFFNVVPDDPRLIRNIYVNLAETKLRPKAGDRVIVTLNKWENRHVNPEGIITEVLGASDDPALDVLVIIKKFGFRVDFPDEALEEADSVAQSISDEEKSRRLDFTREWVVTIDPDDARDYDDALSLKKLPNGNLQLGVHIADVSHYVKPGSELDREAKARGNSVYLPDRVIPMLPPQLSNEMCSLKEGVERLTQTVLFEITPDGEVRSYRFHDSFIKSAARLTYRKAFAVLQQKSGTTDDVKDPDLCQLLRQLWALASKVRARRFAKGSLDLDFPELKVYCSPDGLAERIEKQENDISHQLVEEFMLLANEAVAAETLHRTTPSIYRIHEDPDEEKLEEYREMVLSHGFSMGDPTSPGEIQKLLKQLAGKSEEYILKLHLLRSLKRAQYSTNPIGHFGLAKENYTHFTSPIRRYADLIIHRALIRATRKDRRFLPGHQHESVYDIATLESIAHHCSTTERVADEAEKEAVKLKLIEYFERQLYGKKLDCIDALVTEVRNFGVFVELPEFMLSGLVHVSTLTDDFYHFDPVRQKLTGKKKRRTIQAGSRVKVEVARVDRFKKQVDFRLVEE